MVAGSFTEVCVSTVATDRVWKAVILDVHNLMAKILPEFITSVEIVEGDGGVGTIKKFNFTEATGFTYVKNRVEVLDNKNRVFKYSTIEGGLIGVRMKSLSFEHRFEEGNDGSSVRKVTFEYETLNGTPLSEEEQAKIKGLVIRMMKAVEGYLIANPDAFV